MEIFLKSPHNLCPTESENINKLARRGKEGITHHLQSVNPWETEKKLVCDLRKQLIKKLGHILLPEIMTLELVSCVTQSFGQKNFTIQKILTYTIEKVPFLRNCELNITLL